MKNNNWIKFLFVFICITFASHPSMAEGKVKAPTTKPVVKTPKKAETKAPLKDPKPNETLNKIKPESVKEENTDDNNNDSDKQQ